MLRVLDNCVKNVMIEHTSKINKPRKRTPDPSVIRVGDDVKIIIPEAFDRVGYPLTRRMIIEEMTHDQLRALHNVLNNTFGIGLETSNLFTVSDNTPVVDEIIDIIAGRILCKRGWGGRDRKIYTTLIPNHCIGQVCRVLSKKVVKTGRYVPGWGGYDYWGEYDSSPAYLENEKTHVLYQFSVLIDSNEDGYINTYKTMYFEKRCIQKVIYNSNTGKYE